MVLLLVFSSSPGSDSFRLDEERNTLRLDEELKRTRPEAESVFVLLPFSPCSDMLRLRGRSEGFPVFVFLDLFPWSDFFGL